MLSYMYKLSVEHFDSHLQTDIIYVLKLTLRLVITTSLNDIITISLL